MRFDRTLAIHGFALFLVGLLAGLAVGAVANPRAGLAGHLEGVMNGTFLLAVAPILPCLPLPGRAPAVVRGLLVFGTWINLVGTEASAVFGTGRTTPIAGGGHVGPEWAEAFVAVCLGLTVPTMVPALALLLWGALRLSPAGPPDPGRP